MQMTVGKYKSIAHCAINIMEQHVDWTNKMIADEVTKIMGSRTGPGNISWYKRKIKKGELNKDKYIDSSFKETNLVLTKKDVINIEIEIPKELIVTEEDIIQAKGIQKIALEFYKNKTDKNFRPLYKRLKPGMMFHAMNLLKDKSAADDVVSISFTKMWVKIEQYNKYWNFSTWAYKIVHNEAMQHMRKNKMFIGIDSHDNYSSSEVTNSNFEYNLIHKGADQELISIEPEWEIDKPEDIHQLMYEKVLMEINSLSKFYKEIMVDRELNGMKYKQIADKYNININSVKTRIKRARMKIIENNPEYFKLIKTKNKKTEKTLNNKEIIEAIIKCKEIGID